VDVIILSPSQVVEALFPEVSKHLIGLAANPIIFLQLEPGNVRGKFQLLALRNSKEQKVWQ